MLTFKYRQFKQAIILMAVRWYLSYRLSYRDIEEFMKEHGINVEHDIINHRVIRCFQELENNFHRYHKSSTYREN